MSCRDVAFISIMTDAYVPHVTARVTFTVEVAPRVGAMPQLVMKVPPATRGKTPAPEKLLAIRLLEMPAHFKAGQPTEVVFALFDHPGVPYSEVTVGALFVIREGDAVIADGIVLSRRE